MRVEFSILSEAAHYFRNPVHVLVDLCKRRRFEILGCQNTRMKSAIYVLIICTY